MRAVFQAEQPFRRRSQRFLLLGEVEAHEVMLRFVEEAGARDAGGTDLPPHPFGGFEVGLEAGRGDVEQYVVRALQLGEGPAGLPQAVEKEGVLARIKVAPSLAA